MYYYIDLLINLFVKIFERLILEINWHTKVSVKSYLLNH